MKTIDIKKYMFLNKEKRLKEIYSKTLKLNKKICKLKKIQVTSNDFLSISRELNYNSIFFRDLSYLCKDLYEIKNDKTLNIEDEDFKYMLKLYNDLIEETQKYEEKKKLIKKKGFVNLEEEYKKKIRELLIKMLDYKNRKYNSDATLIELLEEIDLCYHDFNYIWTRLYQLLNGKCIYEDRLIDDFWKIEADDVEYLEIMEESYNYFAKDEDVYKNYNQIYEDITLQENQTIKDLYNSEIEKLRKLYIEMLEFRNVKIEQDDYKHLEREVEKNFPRFVQTLIRLESDLRDVQKTYIDSIDEIRRVYKILKENYQENS